MALRVLPGSVFVITSTWDMLFSSAVMSFSYITSDAVFYSNIIPQETEGLEVEDTYSYELGLAVSLL